MRIVHVQRKPDDRLDLSKINSERRRFARADRSESGRFGLSLFTRDLRLDDLQLHDDRRAERFYAQ